MLYHNHVPRQHNSKQTPVRRKSYKLEATQSIFCKMMTPPLKPNPLSSYKRGAWNTKFTILQYLMTQKNLFFNDT